MVLYVDLIVNTISYTYIPHIMTSVSYLNSSDFGDVSKDPPTSQSRSFKRSVNYLQLVVSWLPKKNWNSSDTSENIKSRDPPSVPKITDIQKLGNISHKI